MAGTLFVVATPIGNLEDITLRALRVLRDVDLIAAEDTRRTAKLLTHHGISTPTISFHEHNIRGRVPQLLARLEGGNSVALVTDAGTPGVSDPGIELVKACIERNVPVDPIPGVSAPLTAAIASGFPLTPLTVFGFAPYRSIDRTRWLSAVTALHSTFTFFEAPHRIRRTLGEAAQLWGNRPIVVGRELTKVHQEFLRGTATSVLERLETPRGEFTVVVGPAELTAKSGVDATDSEIVRVFGEIANNGRSTRGAAVSEVAKRFAMSRKDVYRAIERAKLSVE